MLFSPWKIFHCNESHKGKKKKNQEPTTLGQAAKCLPWPLFNSRAACLAPLRPPPHVCGGARWRRAHQAQPALYNPTQGRRQELMLGWACVGPESLGRLKTNKGSGSCHGRTTPHAASRGLAASPPLPPHRADKNEIQTEPRHLYCP